MATATPNARETNADGTPQPDGDRLIAAFTHLVEPLGRSLPPSMEVVLHDLARLPNSIVAVWGDVTGRRVGDPATDLLLEQASSGAFRDMVGYRTRLPDGRSMRSTTVIIRDGSSSPVAALCVNSDLSVWQSLERMASLMTQPEPELVGPAPDAEDGSGAGEVFARDVDELAAHLIHHSIREQQVPVELMKKEHKLAVVRSLQGRGMFLLRDAVEMIAGSLHVTRFTIYNYLNEIAEERDGADASASPTSTGSGRRAERQPPGRKGS